MKKILFYIYIFCYVNVHRIIIIIEQEAGLPVDLLPVIAVLWGL